MLLSAASVSVVVGLASFVGGSSTPSRLAEAAKISVDGGSLEDLLGCGPNSATEIVCALRVISESANSLALQRETTTLVDLQNRNFKPSYVQIGPEKGDIAHFPKDTKLPIDGSIVFSKLELPKDGFQTLRISLNSGAQVEFNKPRLRT